MHTVNPEFASFDSKNKCTRTKYIFPPYMRLALEQWPLQRYSSVTHNVCKKKTISQKENNFGKNTNFTYIKNSLVIWSLNDRT